MWAIAEQWCSMHVQGCRRWGKLYCQLAAWLEPSLWNQMPTLWSIHSSYSVIWSIVCIPTGFFVTCNFMSSDPSSGVFPDESCLSKECGSQHPQQEVISSLFCPMAYWSQQFETIVFVSFLSWPILLSPLVLFQSSSDLTNSLEPGTSLGALQVVDKNPTENKVFGAKSMTYLDLCVQCVCNIILIKSDPDCKQVCFLIGNFLITLWNELGSTALTVMMAFPAVPEFHHLVHWQTVKGNFRFETH